MIGRLYKKYVRLDIGIGKKWKEYIYPTFEIHFTMEGSDTTDADAADITIYNLSTNTIRNIEEGTPVRLYGGFYQDPPSTASPSTYGMIFSGTVSEKEVTYEQADEAVKLHCLTDMKQLLSVPINHELYWTEPTYTNEILGEIAWLAHKNGLILSYELPKEEGLLYKSKGFYGETYWGAIQQICKDNKYIFRVTPQSRLVIKSQTGASANSYIEEVGYVLNKNTGLIEAIPDGSADTENVNERTQWKITALLLWKVGIRSLVKVEGKYLNSTCLVNSYKMISDESTNTIEMTVTPYPGNIKEVAYPSGRIGAQRRKILTTGEFW